jgi:glutaredoxin
LPALACTVLIALGPAQAQVPYKWIGPDGRVNYGDRPPPGARPFTQSRTEATPGSKADPASGARARPAASAVDPIAVLPYELRLAAQRHPVTVFVTNDCEPCDQGRSHLRSRGVPFAIKEVRTQADASAFTQLGFASLSFPSISVGSDRMSGFDAARWDRLLDISGYPKSARLPATWREPVVEPLAPPQASEVTLPESGAPGAGIAGTPELVPVSPLSGGGARSAREAGTPATDAPSIRF